MIRKATEDDLRAIVQVVDGRIKNPGELISDSRVRDALVYEEATDVIGFVACGRSKIFALYVEPKRQRKDVGTRLLNEIESLMRSRGVTTAFVDVDETDSKAWNFWTGKHSYTWYGLRSAGSTKQLHRAL
jgi:ribosomal protein S18 acetylase RimI-like enzyme